MRQTPATPSLTPTDHPDVAPDAVPTARDVVNQLEDPIHSIAEGAAALFSLLGAREGDHAAWVWMAGRLCDLTDNLKEDWKDLHSVLCGPLARPSAED